MFFLFNNSKQVDSCQDIIAAVFRGEAARADRDRECMLFDLLCLALMQGEKLYVNSTGNDHYHAANCWNSVGNMLSEGSSKDVERARVLEGRLIAADPQIPAEDFFGIVAGNWDLLSRFTYTWRALADIVDMTVGWPNDDRARRYLKDAITLIVGLEEFAND